LFFGKVDRCVDGSFDFGFVGTNARQKDTAESVQFRTAPALLELFGKRYCLFYRVKSFGGTICKVQSFRF
jgi:hypothetical protein